MSTSNNAAASSSSSSSSSTFTKATWRRTRFQGVPTSNKSSSFPISQNSIDVHHSSLLDQIQPFPLNSPISLAAQHGGLSGTSKRRMRNQLAHVEAEKQAEKEKRADILRRNIKASKRIQNRADPLTKPPGVSARVKKPLHSSDAAFDVHCRCPSMCPSHPGDTPANAIQVETEDPLPRATLAQRIRAPLILLPPSFDDDNRSVETNLAAIVAIKKWYEHLEMQALIQLGLNPFNMEDDRELYEKKIDIEFPLPFPTDL